MSSEQPSRIAYASDAALRRLLTGTCTPTLASALIQTRAGARVSARATAIEARPVAIAQSTLRAGKARLATLHDPEAIRAATIQTLTAAPLFADPARLAEPARALLRAEGAEATRAAAQTYLATAQAAHMDLLVQAATVAVRRAAITTGYPTVTVRQVQPGIVRVFGADAQGAGIATELRLERGELALQSEVVGVADPQCAAVLERFNAAVDGEGLRLRRGPVRQTRGKATGPAAQEMERMRAAPGLARTGARATTRTRQRA